MDHAGQHANGGGIHGGVGSGQRDGLVTHAGGIQAIAANGPVSLQAHTDQLEILADKAITIVSVNDIIEVKASQKIVLQAGQSSVTLEGGNITFACPGNFTVKGGQHIFQAGGSSAAALPALPSASTTICLECLKKAALQGSSFLRR